MIYSMFRFKAQYLFLFAIALQMLFGAPAWAQSSPTLPFSMEEIQAVQALRELRQTGDPKAILQSTSTYLKKFPNGRYVDEVLVSQAEAYTQINQPKKALAAYERVIQNFPDSPFRDQARAGSVPILEKIGKKKQASKRMDNLRKEAPGSPFANQTSLVLAKGNFARKDYAGTLAQLASIKADASLSPAEQADLLRLRGHSFYQTGKKKEALATLRQYARYPDNSSHQGPTLILLAGLEHEQGRSEEALNHYETVAGLPDNPTAQAEARYRRGLVLSEIAAKTSNKKAATEFNIKATEELGAYLATGDPRFAQEALQERARIFTGMGRGQEALADFDRLAAVKGEDGVSPQFQISRANLLTDLKRGQEGDQLLSKTLTRNKLSPADRLALTMALAHLRYRRADCPGVIKQMDPFPPLPDQDSRKQAFFLRGMCHYRLHQWEQASWNLEGLVNDPAYQPKVWEPLVESYEKSGQWARLVNLGESLLASERVKPTEGFLKSLGQAYQQMGQPQKMAEVLARLEKLNPKAINKPELHYQLGRGQESLSNKKEAEKHYLNALELTSKKPPAEATLAALDRLSGLLQEKGEHKRMADLEKKVSQRAKSSKEKHKVLLIHTKVQSAWAVEELSKKRPKSAHSKFRGAEKQLLAAIGKIENNDSKGKKSKKTKPTKLSPEAEKNLEELHHSASQFYLTWGKAFESRSSKTTTITRYKKALNYLPAKDWRNRQEIAYRLDGLYQKTGDHKSRVTLYKNLAEIVPEKTLQAEIERYLSRVYLDWGQAETKRKRYKTAMKLFETGLSRLPEKDVQGRYAFLAGMSPSYLATGKYPQLIEAYEKLLPALKNETQQEQVKAFVGQIYLAWAQQGVQQKQQKSASIRATKALKLLPESDWQRRVAATAILTDEDTRKKNYKTATKRFETLIPTLPKGTVQQQYALYLGERLRTDWKNPKAAEKWLKAADTGGNDALSVEAGYRLSELNIGLKKEKTAIEGLKDIVARDLSNSKWEIPVHYQLAVLYHQTNQLEEAANQYEQVANAKSATSRKAYPRSISRSKQQAQKLREYLEFQGKQKGRKIAIPKPD